MLHISPRKAAVSHFIHLACQCAIFVQTFLSEAEAEEQETFAAAAAIAEVETKAELEAPGELVVAGGSHQRQQKAKRGARPPWRVQTARAVRATSGDG